MAAGEGLIFMYNFENKRIVVIGTVFMDIKGYPEGIFIPNGRNVGRIEYKYGGVGRNVAQDIAGLGINPVFISITDSTGPGASIESDLKRSGVITDYMLKMPDGIGTWMVIMTPEGDVCANLSKRQSLLPISLLLDEKGDEIFAGADAIAIEVDIEEEIVSRVFKLAEKYNIDVYGVISNMTIALGRLEYINKCKCFVCNRIEAGQLFDLNTDEKKPAEMLNILESKLKEFDTECVIVTLDKDGSVYACRDGTVGACSAKKVDILDSTGAGDSFFAGASAGLICNMSIEEACRLGTDMAAVVIQSTENTYKRDL